MLVLVFFAVEHFEDWKQQLKLLKMEMWTCTVHWWLGKLPLLREFIWYGQKLQEQLLHGCCVEVQTLSPEGVNSSSDPHASRSHSVRFAHFVIGSLWNDLGWTEGLRSRGGPAQTSFIFKGPFLRERATAGRGGVIYSWVTSSHSMSQTTRRIPSQFDRDPRH